jgi:hypothetical protein
MGLGGGGEDYMDVDGEITSKSKKRRKIYNKMYQKPFIIFGL